MGLLDKFLDAIKLNDDYDDDEEFLDDDAEDAGEDDDYKEAKPKKRFFKKFDDDEDLDEGDDFDEEPEPKKAKPVFRAKTEREESVKPEHTDRFKKEKPQKRAKITPMRKSKNGGMEVNVIRPVSMEDTREIADTLLDSCTVVLNLEGLDVDIAQRIIDFTCGACYSLDGSLQKISSYIFILTPSNVDISGDFQSILNGAFDVNSTKMQY